VAIQCREGIERGWRVGGGKYQLIWGTKGKKKVRKHTASLSAHTSAHCNITESRNVERIGEKIHPFIPQFVSRRVCSYITIIFCGAATQRGSLPLHSWGFLDHTQQRTTVGRTTLDEWSARRRDLYLTTHNTHNRHTSMPPVGFELTISADKRPQTYTLDRAATGTG
jgi:hypothetical protein